MLTTQTSAMIHPYRHPIARIIVLLSVSFAAANAAIFQFPSFNSGLIESGSPATSHLPVVSGMPSIEYVTFTVTGDFVPDPAPNDGYSTDMRLEITNGGTVQYMPLSAADGGVLPAGGSTQLSWTGVFRVPYTGGTPIRIRFSDRTVSATDTYRSRLNNVVLSLHPASQPRHTFATFNTGTLTGGGATFTRSLDTASLAGRQYRLFSVTSDFVPGPSPNDAYSSTIRMELVGQSGAIFFPESPATSGRLTGPGTASAGPTLLRWYGLLPLTYDGGTPLEIRFKDVFNDASGPYTSSLQNVRFDLYPVTTPVKKFNSVNSGVITGGGAPVSVPLNVAGTPATDYVYYQVTGQFAAVGGQDAWSQTTQMQLAGAGGVHRSFSFSNSGLREDNQPATLTWRGILHRSYLGGDALNILFRDTYATGSFQSTMSNVVVSFFPVYQTPVTVSSLARANPSPSNQATVNWTLTLGEATGGINASNFTLSPAPAGASVGTPLTSNAGLTWTIPVNTGSGDGDLRLNLANTTGWSSPVSNTLPLAGETYLIDKTPPVITSPSTAAGTYGTTFSYTITASGAATSFSATNLPAGMSFGGSSISGTPQASGAFNISLSATDAAGNTGAATLNLTVAKAELTVTANPITRAYSLENPALTYGFSGFVGSDSASVLSGAPILTTAATATSVPGDYPIEISLGTLSAAHYQFGFAGGTLTVAPFTPKDWRKVHFSAAELLDPLISGFEADADGDGVANLLELAFGTDPRSPASGQAALTFDGDFSNAALLTNGQPLQRFEPTQTGVDFRVLFIRLDPVLSSGLDYLPEFSGDLGTWRTSSATPIVHSQVGMHQLVSIPYPFFVDGKKARFFRVGIVLAP